MALLQSYELLKHAPLEFTDAPLQARFDAARSAGKSRALQQLEARLGYTIQVPGDEVRIGFVGGIVANLDPMQLVERAVEAAWGPGRAPAMLVSTEMSAALDAAVGAEGRVDPRRPANVARRLDEGWQLRVRDPHGLPAEVRSFVDDLALAIGIVRSELVYGIRSALGAPPPAEQSERLYLQLAGTRSVLVSSEGDQNQMQVRPGQLLYVPSGHQASHLPLDEDSMHLELVVDGDQPAADRAVLAMVPPISHSTFRSARAVIAADPEQGWLLRMVVPGGVHVVDQHPDHVDLVAGAVRFSVTAIGASVIEQLAAGAYHSAAALADSVQVDAGEVTTMLEDLWEIGLIDAAAPVPTGPANDGTRLSQVASADTSEIGVHNQVLASIDEGAWRPPVPGEIHFGDHVEVDVQPLEIDDPSSSPLAQAVEMVRAMNAQFFKARLRGLATEDPPLIVRVRPGASDTGDWLTALGSDIVAHPTRKLTFAVSLTNSEGGFVFLPAGSTATNFDAGALSVWVAARPWVIEPIGAGERLFLIGRIHGPPFT